MNVRVVVLIEMPIPVESVELKTFNWPKSFIGFVFILLVFVEPNVTFASIRLESAVCLFEIFVASKVDRLTTSFTQDGPHARFASTRHPRFASWMIPNFETRFDNLLGLLLTCRRPRWNRNQKNTAGHSHGICTRILGRPKTCTQCQVVVTT